jgi:hypothetical protein
MQTRKIFIPGLVIALVLLALSQMGFSQEGKKRAWLGHATSFSAGSIISRNTFLNFEIGRTYGFARYLTNPVDIIHSITGGIGIDYNLNTNTGHYYKAFLEYDFAMFTYVHRTLKFKFDLLKNFNSNQYFFRPSIGISRHIRIKQNLDTKIELLYGYTFNELYAGITSRHCLTIRLKHNINYIRKFLRVI